MLNRMRFWLATNRTLLMNTSSLVGTTAVTSGLGFAYWWVAARLFPQAEVGFASAAVASMQLLGAMSLLGLGTLLIGELRRTPERAGTLITTALQAAGTAAVVFGVLYGMIAATLSPELASLSRDGLTIAQFTLGVVLTTTTLLIDQMLIGLLRGGLQLWRNTVFAVFKLVALWVAGHLLAAHTGMTIYDTWLLGNLVSVLVLLAYALYRRVHLRHPSDWSMIRSLGRMAFGHHLVNLAIQAPGLILPIAVTIVLGAETNASFFAAWMLAMFAFIIPRHLSTVLFAVGTGQPELLAQKLRMTLKLSLIVGVISCTAFFLLAGVAMNFFGAGYAASAEWCLRIMAFGIFPLMLKDHFIAVRRVNQQVEKAVPLMVVGSLFEVIFAIIGMSIGGLNGLAVGWVVALSLEALLMTPVVYQAAAFGANRQIVNATS